MTDQGVRPVVQTPSYPPHPTRQSSGLSVVLVFLGGGFALMVFFFAMVYMAVTSETPDFSDQGKIGIVEVKGAIEDSKETLKALREFAKDEAIKGVVLRVDSPGGAVGPSQEIFRAVEKLRKTKPVVASMGSIAASGGYYISCAAERIFANPGTMTGSIGVIMMTSYIEELMRYLKIEMVTYKSGEHKDMLSPFRPATDSDRELVNAMIQDVYDQFLSDVAKARKIEIETLRPIADGRVLTGRQAFNAKLVDEFGNFDDATDYLAEKVGLGDDYKIAYPKEDSLSRIEKLFESVARGTTKALTDHATPTVAAQARP